MRCLACSVLQYFSRWCCGDLYDSVLQKFTMALNERACRGKRGGEGLADLDEGERQCTCPLTREEIKSDYLPEWKELQQGNGITNWKCPTCKHDFAAHATGNFHIPRIKLSWYCPHIRSGHSVVCAQVQPLPLRPVRVLPPPQKFTHSSICSSCVLLVGPAIIVCAGVDVVVMFVCG